MSQDTYFSLDWRDAPSSKAIVEEIMRIFKDLDGQGAARMCLSASTAQGTVRFVEGEDGVAMIRRRNNKVGVLSSNGSSVNLSGRLCVR